MLRWQPILIAHENIIAWKKKTNKQMISPDILDWFFEI